MVQMHTNTEMLFRRWQQTKTSKSLVMEELGNQGLSAEEITTLWDQYYRYRLAKRCSLGWLLMAIGGFVGLIACVLTIIDLVPEFRGFLMYILTSASALVALYGCYLVMEKPYDMES
jgi:hypothetical protein